VVTARDSVLTPQRLGAVRRFADVVRAGRLDLGRSAMLAGAVLDVPTAWISVVGEVQTFLGVHGTERPAGSTARLDHGVCSLVVARGVPVAVDDLDALAPDDPRTALRATGAVAYLGVPLVDDTDSVVGTLAALDHVPRRWTARDHELLRVLASATVTEVSAQHGATRRERLLEAFGSTPVALAVVRAHDGAVEYVNPAFADLFPLVGRPAGPTVAVSDLGLPAVSARVAEVAVTGRPVRDEVQPVRGEDRVAAVTYSPVHGTAGGPPDVLVVGLDITAQVRERRSIQRHADEQQLLARATAAMQDAVEPAAELDALVRSLVPQFADGCSAILLEHRVPPGRAAGCEVTGIRVAFAAADDLADPTPPLGATTSWGSRGLLADTVRAGRPLLADVVADTAESAEGAGSLGWLRGVGVSSLAAAPIRVEGDVVGLLVFAVRPGRPAYTRADLAVMERVSVRAGAALGQGLTYQRQRETSLALQRSLLTDAPMVPGLEVATRYRPTAIDTEVGGDWYDAFALPGGDLAITIGDVAGHDLASAATMGQLRSMLRALAWDRDAEPGDIVARLDRAATGLRVTEFTTLVHGRLRLDGTMTLSWSNAGHPPPLLLHADGRAELLADGAGMVMGVLPERDRPTAVATLPEGSTLLLYTDGLVERRGSDPDADAATLVEAAVHGTDGTLDGLCDRLVEIAPVADDVALLAVRIGGRTG
jgi:GAF domain-containing protein